MNTQVKNLIHDLRGKLDQINTCFSCIVFDLREMQKPNEADISDLKKSLDSFNAYFEVFTKNLKEKNHDCN